MAVGSPWIVHCTLYGKRQAAARLPFCSISGSTFTFSIPPARASVCSRLAGGVRGVSSQNHPPLALHLLSSISSYLVPALLEAYADSLTSSYHPFATMSFTTSVSSLRSLARLTIDITVGLVYVIPAMVMHQLATTFPSLSPTRLTSPPNSFSTLRSRNTAPIAISRRYLSVHNRLVVAEELEIAAMGGTVPASTSPVPPPPQPPVHFFLITGNPGTIHFYLHFLSRLHHLSHRALHIHSLSFAGHQSVAALERSVSAQPLYDLKDQTDIWLAYLREWTEQHEEQGEKGQVVLCGHSIGAWMALELADQLGGDRILHSFLLFPTLSQMARTPAGKRLQYPFAYGRPVFVLLARLIVTFVPTVLLRMLVGYILSFSYPHTTANRRIELDDTADTVVELFSPYILSQCFYLAHSELQTVVDERPSHTRLMAEGRATLVSGAADEWDPAWVQEERRERIQGLREVRMEKGVRHAFVAGDSERVAEIVWQELQKLTQPRSTDEQANGQPRKSKQRLHRAEQVVV